ncbi:MAG: aldehyde dehydrogenase EutE [Chloroflexi bacterium]|nr:aldehyde dehydrogenase EutE [Chloroflexota bacterium]
MTSPVSDQQVSAIVQKVLAELRAGSVPPRGSLSHTTAPPAITDGVFGDVDAAVTAARAAFEQLNQLTLAKRYEIIAAIRAEMLAHAEELAKMAHSETGLGRWPDKLQKNLLCSKKTPGPEFLEPITWTGDHGLTLLERAPYGVVAAITPTTNPTSTIINNSISILSAGNAAVFNVHPNAKRVSAYQIQLLNRTIVRAGGPPNLITTIAEPTIESAQQLMRHRLARLLLVTGGPGVVKEAMQSGKRAITAGPGNPPVVVDETADLEKAGRDIVFGASFDNNVICTDEKEVFCVESIADQLKAIMARHGAYELRSHELKRLEKVIFSEIGAPMKPGVINKDFIGKNAAVVLKELGINVGDDVRLVLVDVPAEHPLVWTEQMMPVLPLARVRSADEGIDLAKKAEHGFGHTASMFSRNIDNLSRMAREINTSIFVKNGPTLAGLGFGGEGYTSFSIASPTGEGLTTARTFSRERRCTLVDHFRIV